MVDKTTIQGGKVLVVGAGCSGLAALRLLAEQGCQLWLSDGGSRQGLSQVDQDWLEENDVACEFEGHSQEFFSQAELIVVSPGVPLEMAALVEAQQQGTPVIGELELGWLFVNEPVIAITGTNGKSTVTTLVAQLLESQGKKVFVGGNIGTPLCHYVNGADKAEVLVLEVSSFQLDTAVSFRPRVGVLLNISPDHLDRYPSYQAYGDSKMRLFMNQANDDLAIINGDDQEVLSRKQMLPGQVQSFSRNDQGCEEGLLLVNRGNTEQYQLPSALNSSPNRENCQAAIMAARALGCSKEAVQKGLSSFRSLDHRLTEVLTINGVRFVDDSKATNIGAVQSALAGLQGGVILIAGGRDKGGDYRLLRPQVKQVVKHLVLLGEAAEEMATALADLVSVEQAKSMAEAVRLAAARGQKGDVVLLSPACASFDMFSSYGERGDVFCQAVHELAGHQDRPIKIKAALGEAA